MESGERSEWCPGGAFAEGENEVSSSIEASSGLKRQHCVLSAAGGSDPSESTERESKARSKGFERPLRLRRRAAEIPD